MYVRSSLKDSPEEFTIFFDHPTVTATNVGQQATFNFPVCRRARLYGDCERIVGRKPNRLQRLGLRADSRFRIAGSCPHRFCHQFQRDHKR